MHNVKLEENMTWPRTLHIGMAMNLPDPSAKIMFRKRTDYS